MRKPNITKADIATVATEIMTFKSDLPSPKSFVNSDPPAVRVIHCVLSLNRRYTAFVLPRENAFKCNHPEIKQITELAALMKSCTAYGFLDHSLKEDCDIIQSHCAFQRITMECKFNSYSVNPTSAYLTLTALLETARWEARGNGACLRT